MSRVAPFGTWLSPLSAANVAAGGLRLAVPALDGDDVYWLEGRPREGGRYALVRRTPDGRIADVTPPEINIRSRVHEYGGDAYAVARGVVYCANFDDQRVYRVSNAVAEPITPAGDWFYADFQIDTRRQRLICVREDHTQRGHEAVNTLVSISLEWSAWRGRRDCLGLRLLLDTASQSRRLDARLAVMASSARCHGTGPSSGWRTSMPLVPSPTRCAGPAARTSRSTSRAGPRTARCTTSAIEAAGGSCTARRTTRTRTVRTTRT